ncbi:L-fucose isomerase and related proteins [uncultured Roseburia sp.]|uniref:Fucose isomerase n=1 Tax=Brotonthovivens ammoniilytica TaxID=2981725 RepID=A0ABT2TNX0_9FIRM|nr:fucose isomerase [Brotonthovivens ammoniilytica]MCU6763466.1 fucose isomerase [Brotonthovivens ammoniilytica]SCJ20277.1 L-fucose isomerase and related proteins [uncultured Roseburia sp.]
MIKKSVDVVLRVRPVFLAIIHEYSYEGPCRFGKGEQLEKSYEVMMAQELYKKFKNNISKNITMDGIEILDPIYVERDDWFVTKEDMFLKMAEDIEQVDFFIFSTGIGRGDLYLEFAQRYKKPMGVAPQQCCGPALNTAAVRARGLESYSYRTWDDLRTHLRVMRAKKALAETRVLLASRFNSTTSFSTPDTFVNINEIADKFGIRFRNINAHELIDQTHMVDPTTNPTLPGRKALNINEEDMVLVEKITDELIAGAQFNKMEREKLKKSVVAYVTVQKLMEFNDCNAFTIPCPDICSTRRMNEEQITFCLTHSLNNEQGIPSACEFDINSLVTMVMLTNLSGKAPYMGNTNCVYYDEDGKMVTLQNIGEDDIQNIKDADRANLYLSFHSTPNRKLKGLSAKTGSYGIAPFAHGGFGATFRYDFGQDNGQEITLAKISPDGNQLFVAKATICGGAGYDRMNCDQGVFFTVEDQEDFFYKQINFGNHCPLVYGDYTKELIMLGKAYGLEVVTA